MAIISGVASSAGTYMLPGLGVLRPAPGGLQTPPGSPLPIMMKGKVCVVTGASSGIGRSTAAELVRMGSHVVIVCRDEGRGREALAEVTEGSSVPTAGGSVVELLLGDFVRMSEVRRLAAEIQGRHEKVHVLVNNAGSNFPRYEKSEDGFEKTMALNYFSPFLLTTLLLPALIRAAPSRVVNVASSAHTMGEIDPAHPDSPEGGGRMFGWRPYSRSKLALVMFTYELARRLEGTSVTANAVSPGAVRTRLWNHVGKAAPIFKLASAFMRSPDKGAETVVYLASSPEVEGATGGYYFDRAPRHSSRRSTDAQAARTLWETSARLLGLEPHTTGLA